MTRDTTESDWTRRGLLASIGAAAVATIPGIGAAQTSEETADALFEDPTLTDRAAGGLSFALGLAAGIRTRIPFGQESQQEIDRLVTDTVEEFESHTASWLEYVNTRDLGGSDYQILRLTFEYGGESRERWIIADYNPLDGAEEYVTISVEEEYPDEPDVSATLRDDAVENAADELATLHDEYIVPGEDVDRSYVSRLAGKYYWGSDHVTASFLGGG